MMIWMMKDFDDEEIHTCLGRPRCCRRHKRRKPKIAGPMDGVIGWAWVGKERQLPLTVVKPPLIHTFDIPHSDFN